MFSNTPASWVTPISTRSSVGTDGPGLPSKRLELVRALLPIAQRIFERIKANAEEGVDVDQLRLQLPRSKVTQKQPRTRERPTAILPTGSTDVPGDVGLALTLSGVRPNPSMSQALVVDFTLPSPSPATVEFLDVMGRRLVRPDVASMGAGRHIVDLAAHVRLAPGRYSLRLTQGGESRVSQVVVTP